MDVIPSFPAATAIRPLFHEKGRAFRAVPQAVPACRRVVQARLLARGLNELSNDACTVTTELAANAVNAMHAEQRPGQLGGLPPMMVLSLEWIAAGVRIGIWDGAAGFPDIGIPAADTENGRGLLIVSALTAGRWGWFAADAGKCVWADIVRTAAPSP